MKKEFFVSLVFMFFLIPSIAFADTLYQENANDTACLGTWDFLSPCSNVYDSNWDNSGFAGFLEKVNITLVYIKPDNALNATWLIGDYDNEAGNRFTNYTLDIPSDCWDANEENISFIAESEDVNVTGNRYLTSKWMCYNGSWKTLATFDHSGDYEHLLVEEGIYWELSEPEEEEEEQGLLSSVLLPILPLMFVLLIIINLVAIAQREKGLTPNRILSIALIVVLAVVMVIAITSLI